MNKYDELMKLRDNIIDRLSAEKDDRYKNLTIDEVIKIINQSSVNGKYSLWTIKEYLKGNIQRFEDIESRCKQGLEIFKNNLHKFTNEQKQIHKLSFHDLENLIQPFKDELSNKALKKIEKEKVWSEIDVIYSGPEGKILVPKTEQSSVFLGKGTKWCTASLNWENRFNYYNSSGSLYIFITNDKDEEGREIKFQLHIESDQFMDMEDEKVDEAAFDKYYNLFKELLDEKIYEYLVKNTKYMDYFIDKNNEELRNELFLRAVKHNGYAIQYINNPTDEIKLEACRLNGIAIQYIDNPSEEMKIEAVKQNGWAIKYINNPTDEVKLEVVKQDGYVIQYIDNPSEEMKIEAVKQDGWAIQYIKNPTDEMKLEACKSNGYAITYIKNPTEEMKLEAVKQDGEVIQYIDNPSDMVKKVANREVSDYKINKYLKQIKNNL